jgi:hypothetical protein
MTPTRREFLGTTAAAGLSLAAGSPASANPTPTGRARSCIFLMLTGGPSHLDTWDPKPDAPSTVRGPFTPTRTRVPGMHVSELFPKMAAMADKFSLVRGLHHTAAPIHETGFQLLNTGRLFRDGPEWPSVGSVVRYVTDPQSEWCTGAPLVVPTLDINTGVRISHGQSGGLRGRPHVWPDNEVDTANPTAAMIRYGMTTFGMNCSWAGTTIAGMALRSPRAFITVNMYSTVFDAVSWDCHADGGALATDLRDYRDTVAPTFDTAFTALLSNLEDRGLLDETLVVAVGEFGRTPKLNANGGRDHWPGCWTAVVAGGGVQGGRVIGASDAIGAEPADRPVTCPELVATIYHALGIDPRTPVPGPDGTPAPAVEAEPVRELF